MRFAIAIPVFGQQAFLPTALESLRSQKAAYELAIMDATPDDSVQRIVDEYADICHYRRHGPDAGQSSAIQEGWDRVSGDVLAWLCADDYYFPDTLTWVEQVFHEHPEVDVVYGDSVFVDAKGRFKSYFPGIASDVCCLPFHNCIAQPSCFVRRSAIERIGGLNLGLHYIMDWDLWVRLYNNGARFHYVHKPLSVTRIYPETKTGSMSPARYREIDTHLRTHASARMRLRSLLGMLHHDLHERAEAGSQLFRFLETPLRAYTWAKARMRMSKSQVTPVLYGLERGSNLVRDRCSILLPWYHHKLPKYIRPLVKGGTIQTMTLSGAHVRPGEYGEFWISDASALSSSRLVHLELQMQTPCRLLAVEFAV